MNSKERLTPLGKCLNRRQQQLCLNQKDIAEEIGCSKKEYRRWLYEPIQPQAFWAKKIRTNLAISDEDWDRVSEEHQRYCEQQRLAPQVVGDSTVDQAPAPEEARLDVEPTNWPLFLVLAICAAIVVLAVVLAWMRQ